MNSSIQNQANEIESWLNENLSAFQIVKQTIEGVNPDDNEMQGILNQYYGYDADYPEGLYIADENGKLMMAEGVAKSETNPTEYVYMVVKPVKKLTNVITSMTEGDFTVEIDVRNRDEIGMMSRGVETFVESMRNMISSIRGVSDKLHTQANNSNDVSGLMYDD